MSKAPDSRRKLFSGAWKELGCGLLTVLAFTAPLWAFSMATRGPRFALTALLVLGVALAALVIITRLIRWR